MSNSKDQSQMTRRIRLELDNIDPELLRKQKLGLINVVFRYNRYMEKAKAVDIDMKEDLEALEGILSLIDNITDKIDSDEYVLTEIFKKT